MTKRCVRIAYGSEMGEKGVKMGKARLLPGVSRTWVKGNTRRQNPTYMSISTYTEPQEHTCVRKNRVVYTWIPAAYVGPSPHMQEEDKSSSLTFSKRHHPKSILDMFLPFLRHQVFIYTYFTTKPKQSHSWKNTLKPKIREKLENEIKKMKNLHIHPWECDSLVDMSMVKALLTLWLHYSEWDGRH